MSRFKKEVELENSEEGEYEYAEEYSDEDEQINVSPTVVCVKVKNMRPHYDNLEEWMKDPNNLYIGRRGIVFIKKPDGTKERYPKKDSIFANPFKLNKAKDNLDEVIKQFRKYAKKTFTRKDILSLGGKNLGCWCSPDSCHGDILKEMFDKEMKSKS
jgi:hypothetical protein